MSAKKFLRLVAGRVTEIFGVTSSSGVANDGDIPALDASGRLDVSMMPVGVGPDVKVCPSSENLTAGDMVNLYDNGGAINARKADATAVGKEANGYVLANVTSPANATVYFGMINTARSGMTVGATYYLSTTPGGVTTTPPSASGNVVQEVGKALSATELEVTLEDRGIVVA